jgi:ABC-type phosphate transport system permease subunit
MSKSATLPLKIATWATEIARLYNFGMKRKAVIIILLVLVIALVAAAVWFINGIRQGITSLP